ncbi:hypothetical protein A2U01_0054253, partial [Trifolium medium]|nr:hypothetical protein [Trifolium medium]
MSPTRTPFGGPEPSLSGAVAPPPCAFDPVHKVLATPPSGETGFVGTMGPSFLRDSSAPFDKPTFSFS